MFDVSVDKNPNLLLDQKSSNGKLPEKQHSIIMNRRRGTAGPLNPK